VGIWDILWFLLLLFFLLPTMPPQSCHKTGRDGQKWHFDFGFYYIFPRFGMLHKEKYGNPG
jgi:hypothetical protein